MPLGSRDDNGTHKASLRSLNVPPCEARSSSEKSRGREREESTRGNWKERQRMQVESGWNRKWFWHKREEGRKWKNKITMPVEIYTESRCERKRKQPERGEEEEWEWEREARKEDIKRIFEFTIWPFTFLRPLIYSIRSSLAHTFARALARNQGFFAHTHGYQ